MTLTQKEIEYLYQATGTQKTNYFHFYRKNEKLVQINTEDHHQFFAPINALPNSFALKIVKNIPIRKGVFVIA
jgi:hypothetical protein